MSEQSDHRWGDYYLFGGRKGKKSWALELFHTANQMIPTFNELFDKVSRECMCVVLDVFQIIFLEHYKQVK